MEGAPSVPYSSFFSLFPVFSGLKNQTESQRGKSAGGGKSPPSAGGFMAFWTQLASVRPKWRGWAHRVELQLPIMGKVK